MLLLNYLGRKRSESGLVAGFTISVPWDAQKSSDSMEELLNWLLFNTYLTNGLCHAVTRSDGVTGFLYEITKIHFFSYCPNNCVIVFPQT